MLAPILLAMMPQSSDLLPFGAVPHPRQLAWHVLEYYAFVHFGPNTFTAKEWGDGREDPRIFNPVQLDTDQWAKTFRDAGMKAIIITAKHHDGFCLWPSKDSTHTVAKSPWREGKGDVLRLLSESCKKYGLKFGVYLSPWDRNHPSYGTPEYNDVFKRMLRDVLTNYGEVFEVWFDGANGEGPNGKRQAYDWPGFIQVVRECQPNAVIFSDAGPDIRWVGNEAGHSAPTCWATIDRDRYVPGTPHYKELTEGKAGGTHWVPAECDVSIRPGWFYRQSEDSKVKTGEQLFDLYLRSVGQNGAFLLNVPPDPRGLIHENDAKALMDFRRLREAAFAVNVAEDATFTFSSNPARRGRVGAFASPWSPGPGDATRSITLEWKSPQDVSYVDLGEPIALGQRVDRFRVETTTDGIWRTAHMGTTIGRRRILATPVKGLTRLRLTIESSLALPLLQHIKVYRQ